MSEPTGESRAPLDMLRDVPHSHEGEPCTACLRDGYNLAAQPPSGDADLRDALTVIQDIVKPTTMTMSGPRWDGTMGGNKQRIWQLCEDALAAAQPPSGDAPLPGDRDFDATAIDYRRGSPQYDPSGDAPHLRVAIDVGHATDSHYAQVVSCADDSCPLNWRVAVSKVRE